ncbi:glutaredoxin domain-containing cysteine-rich protein 2 isoform X2 [Rana temporaria]|uniref:glutaredoxin domain-containing cysteine-rich protein 2 isoform X2 n=1 Tax=Rana temporaria TaxID=8407 RepID=UPI001AAC658C|nr:glutaredoxin domain-containing cysteine-rich protein 2 isoform X2 [Rana temporaria]
MDELQKKLNQRYAERPRKVRFKISSAYSGRVLKQVFEDGQELESPDEEYPHSFLHDSFETSEHYFSSGEAHPQFYPTARLTAQRISVFRDGTSYRLASDPLISGSNETDKSGRAVEKDLCHRSMEGNEIPEMNKTQDTQDEEILHHCPQCKGSGCSPCALCHGSKLTMLANRFKESYRALRCPACDKNGLQPCRTCAYDSGGYSPSLSPRS